MGSLKPHTAYMIRIAAINQIDRSAFTEPVVVKTQEEGKLNHDSYYFKFTNTSEIVTEFKDTFCKVSEINVTMD